MSFSTPTPRRRAPPRRTAQSVFDTSGSQVSSTAPSLAPTSSGAFTPRAAVQTPIGHRFQPAAAQDELMTDAAMADGTVSVAGSSVFGGSVLSELPDEHDGGRPRKAGAGARPREVWMNDGRVEVWKKGSLPSAVQHVLDASDLYTSPLSATFSQQTGFASLLTHSELFVWSYLKPHSTLYTFPLPPPASSHPSLLPPKSHALILPAPSSTSSAVVAASREPSVLVVGPAGELRFWDSLSAALVDGGSRYAASSAIGPLLADGESVDGLWSAGEGLGAVATGDKGSVWKVGVSYPGGTAQIDVAPFPKAASAGFLGFFRSSSAAASSSDTRSAGAAQHTLVLPLDSARLLLISPQGVLQTYSLPSPSKAPVLSSSTPLLPQVLAALHADEREGLELSLEMHDLQALSPAEVGVLVSFEEEGMLEGGRRSAIVGVTASAQGQVKVTRVIESSTRIDLDPRPLPRPSFIPLPKSQQALLVLPTSLLLISLAATKSFEEHLLLKDSARNAFLGVGSLAVHGDEVGIVMKSGGFAALTVSPLGVAENGTGKDADTRRLKSRLEQAIFFGTNAANPLSFDLTPSLPGSLLASTTALSAQIVASALPLLPPVLDTRLSLAARLQSLTHLVELVGRCGLLGKLSAGAGRSLLGDAERLRAGGEAWAYLMSRMTGEDLTGTPRGLLPDAIALYMTRTPSTAPSAAHQGEDPLRLFFRTRIKDLGKVLEIVGSLVGEALERSSDVEERSGWLAEANRIYLTAFKAAFRHREEVGPKYGLAALDASSSPYSEPWTTTSTLLATLQSLVEQTDEIILRRTREFGSALDEAVGAGGESGEQATQRELKDMLGELAAALLATFEERIRYLLSVLENAVGEGLSDREVVELKDRYLSVRPRVILGLVRVDHSDQAYELAEHHRDFRALVELCNHPSVGSPARTQYYIEKFREDFAFELYQWYIDMGKMKTLLTQDEVYAPLLLSFLDSTDNPRIAWVQDIATKRYDHAAQSLLKESEHEPKLAEKQLMLSIGKLCQVASLSQQAQPSEAARKRLDGVDDRLDLISVHERLRMLFQEAAGDVLNAHGAPASVEENVEFATLALAPNLADFPALRALFIRLGSSLMRGKTLRPEDLIDLLTLKANQAEDQVGDYATALDVLSRARDVPAGRAQMALLSIWRRVYIRDNWAALSTNNLTDQQLENILRSTALYHTLSILQEIAPQTAALSPSDVVLPSSRAPPAELAARCADDSADTIEALWQDLQAEDGALRAYLEESGLEVGKRGLEVWAGEVVRLVGDGAEPEQGSV